MGSCEITTKTLFPQCRQLTEFVDNVVDDADREGRSRRAPAALRTRGRWGERRFPNSSHSHVDFRQVWPLFHEYVPTDGAPLMASSAPSSTLFKIWNAHFGFPLKRIYWRVTYLQRTVKKKCLNMSPERLFSSPSVFARRFERIVFTYRWNNRLKFFLPNKNLLCQVSGRFLADRIALDFSYPKNCIDGDSLIEETLLSRVLIHYWRISTSSAASSSYFQLKGITHFKCAPATDMFEVGGKKTDIDWTTLTWVNISQIKFWREAPRDNTSVSTFVMRSVPSPFKASLFPGYRETN